MFELGRVLSHELGIIAITLSGLYAVSSPIWAYVFTRKDCTWVGSYAYQNGKDIGTSRCSHVKMTLGTYLMRTRFWQT